MNIYSNTEKNHATKCHQKSLLTEICIPFFSFCTHIEGMLKKVTHPFTS